MARSVGYVGFVGILTGVRPGLSLSLNGRRCYSTSKSIRRIVKYYGYYLAVLFRLRPSIASRLQKYILPKEGRTLPTLAELIWEFPSITTTTCYITACDGDRTTILEKDVSTARVRSDINLITVTNHDQACERDSTDATPNPTVPLASLSRSAPRGPFNESIDRKKCLENRWRITSTLRRNGGCEKDCITMEDLKKWMVMYPTANGITNFAATMDPKEGEIVWCRRWIVPFVEPEDSKSDRMSFLSE